MTYGAYCRGATHRDFLCIRRRVISGVPLDYRFIRAVEGRKCVPALVVSPHSRVSTRMAVRPRPARCDKDESYTMSAFLHRNVVVKVSLQSRSCSHVFSGAPYDT